MINNPETLSKQYSNSKNLNTRIQIHTFSTNKYGWMKWIYDHIELPQNAHILELGCGNGKFWLDNIDRIPDGWSIIVSDISEGMLKEAIDCLASEKGNFQFEKIDAQSIPFPDNYFDCVIANHAVHHFPQKELALSEIHRVLKGGGLFYSTAMGINHFKEIRDLLEEFDNNIVFPINSAAMEFGLENGYKPLSKFFKDITLHIYEDSLKIPEIQPIIDYILSFEGMGNVTEILHGERLDKFKDFLTEKFNSCGCLQVIKSSGMFISRA